MATPIENIFRLGRKAAQGLGLMEDPDVVSYDSLYAQPHEPAGPPLPKIDLSPDRVRIGLGQDEAASLPAETINEPRMLRTSRPMPQLSEEDIAMNDALRRMQGGRRSINKDKIGDVTRIALEDARMALDRKRKMDQSAQMDEDRDLGRNVRLMGMLGGWNQREADRKQRGEEGRLGREAQASRQADRLKMMEKIAQMRDARQASGQASQQEIAGFTEMMRMLQRDSEQESRDENAAQQRATTERGQDIGAETADLKRQQDAERSAREAEERSWEREFKLATNRGIDVSPTFSERVFGSAPSPAVAKDRSVEEGARRLAARPRPAFFPRPARTRAPITGDNRAQAAGSAIYDKFPKAKVPTQADFEQLRADARSAPPGSPVRRFWDRYAGGVAP